MFFAQLLKGWRSPVSFLMATNVLQAIVGTVLGLVIARWLGAASYGVIAVIAATQTTALNFVDIRLTDLAARLYYRPPGSVTEDQVVHRAGVLHVCIFGNSLVAVLFCIIGISVGLFGVGLFTDSAVNWQWIIAQALALAAERISTTLGFLQRFTQRFHYMGIWQIAIALTRLSVFIPILWLRPNLNGYYLATIITAGLSLSMNIVSSTWLWRQEGLAVWEWPGAEAWKRYMREWRFLFHGNLLGYVKMLHRSVDMLVVGAFCGNREAGLYKLARVLLDHLLRLFHVMNQVYLPQLLEMLSAQAHVAYLRLSARLAAAAGAITAAGLLAEWLVLPALVIRVLGSSFEGLVPPLMWMTASFFFVAGIHLWTYAAIMHGGMMRQLALFSFLAVAVQYFLMLSLFNVWGASATAAATGYFSYYGVRAAASVRLTHRLLETMRASHS